MKFSKLSETIKNIFVWHSTIRWVILFITLGLFVLILYPSLFMTQPTFQLGDIAGRNIKAPRDFSIEDENATEKHRRQAMATVLTVYDHDTVMSSRLRTQVNQAFQSIRSIGKKLNDDPSPDTLNSTRIRNGGTGQTQSRHNRIWAEKELFIKNIGIPVSEGAYRILEKEGFSHEIENAIINILTQIFDNGVVAHKETLLKEADHGIVFKDLENQTEQIVTNLKQFYGLDQAKAMVRIVGEPLLNKMRYTLRNLVVEFIQKLIRPNITLNQSETAKRRKKIAAEVTPVVSQVKAGEMILREGERVTPDKLAKLQVLQKKNRSRQLLVSGGGAAAVMLCLMLALYTLHHYSKPVNPDRNRDIFCLASIFLTILVISRLGPALSDTLVANLPYNISPLSIYFNAPLAAGAMTVCLLIGLNVAVSFGLVVAMAVAFIFQNRLEILLFFFISGALGAYWVKDCRERTVFIKAGVKVGALNILLITAINAYLQRIEGFSLVWDWMFAFGGGLFAGIITAGLVPFFETAFGYATDIKLLELSNLDRPILRRLMIEAPGTYHHSVIVGSMVEAAAADIGANPLLAKVCGYYHDIGKIEKPLYFIENQPSNLNKHDKLAPSMSKRILVSHVKEGVRIAKEHKLGQRITDTIMQHHGTSVISFFYDKAKNLKGDQPISMDDYRYPGPRPQTKEAGLVMLADMLEAASRTLNNPTPSRIQGLVQRLINKAFSEGQLDQCELTLKDLHNIAKSFNTILNGIHHHRVEYPDTARFDNGNGKSNHRHRQSAKPVQRLPQSDSKNKPERLKRLGLS